jgi:hypothetical protein
MEMISLKCYYYMQIIDNKSMYENIWIFII